jgi:hypothetical protein
LVAGVTAVGVPEILQRVLRLRPAGRAGLALQVVVGPPAKLGIISEIAVPSFVKTRVFDKV